MKSCVPLRCVCKFLTSHQSVNHSYSSSMNVDKFTHTMVRCTIKLKKNPPKKPPNNSFKFSIGMLSLTK